MWRLRTEGENVTIRDIVADGEEVAAKSLRIFEAEVLATAEAGGSLGYVLVQAVARGELDHASEAKRREEFCEAVEVLLAATFSGVRWRVGIAAKAAVIGAGRKWWASRVSEFVCFVFDLGLCAVESECVDGGVGVAELVECFGKVDVAALVEGFAEEQNGAAVVRRLFAEKVCREGQGVEYRSAVVAGLDAIELGRDLAEVRGEAVEELGFAIEVDERDAMWDVAHDGVEERAEVAVGRQVRDAVTSDLDDDYEREGLRVGVIFELEFLRDAVVFNREVVGLECEDELAGFGFDECGDNDQRGADADGGARICVGCGRCLRVGRRCR